MTAPHATTAPHRAAFGALLYALALAATAAPAAAPLVTVPARASTGAGTLSFDGVVEAVRQTGIAAQVSGAVVQLDVKAGDRVRAGQLLLRIDARAADQASLASDAQVRAAQAAQDVATKEYERQQQLHAQRFISAAALDRARAEYQAALAQAQAQAAQAGAARTVSGLHIVRAPYAGVVSDVAPGLATLRAASRPCFQSAPDHAAAGAGGVLLGVFRRDGDAARGRAADQRDHGQRADGPFPGAAVRDVEQMVATPAEQVLSQMAGVEHVMSVSRPGLAVLTVQFKVGVPRTEALVRLHDTVQQRRLAAARPGRGEPIIKPKGIDDVPIVTLTLSAPIPTPARSTWSAWPTASKPSSSACPARAKSPPVGGPGRGVMVEIDPARMASAGVTVPICAARCSPPTWACRWATCISGNRPWPWRPAPSSCDASDVAELVVGVRGGKPVFLRDVAGCATARWASALYVWHGGRAAAHNGGGEYPAVTLRSPRSRARTPSTSPTRHAAGGAAAQHRHPGRREGGRHAQLRRHRQRQGAAS
jgi:multidrug efflux pump subunit AcrA (membrane-fusion protein)